LAAVAEVKSARVVRAATAARFRFIT